MGCAPGVEMPTSPFNRTIVELKLYSISVYDRCLPAFNRTIVELKQLDKWLGR